MPKDNESIAGSPIEYKPFLKRPDFGPTETLLVEKGVCSYEASFIDRGSSPNFMATKVDVVVISSAEENWEMCFGAGLE